jgi:uncharacterized protein (DUF58 family)
LIFYELITWFVGARTVLTQRKLSTHRLAAGQSLEISVSLHLTGIWPLFWLRIREELPERWLLQTDNADRVLQPLWKREFRYSYRLKSLQRGVYVVGNTEVETGDLFGFVRRTRSITRRDEVIVFPRVVTVSGWTGYQPEEIGLRQPTRRRSEESTNVLGVRDYVPGDRLSRIHWPASARRGTLQAKEFELHVSSELMFVPDLSKQSFSQNPATFELEMTIAASLMKHAYETRKMFGAALHGRRLTTFPSGYDESLFLRCMEALAMAEPDGHTNFSKTLSRLVQETPVGATLAVISPRLDQEVAVVSELARRRVQLEWFVPLEQQTMTESEKRGLEMLRAAKVNVYLISSPAQLGDLKRGGVGRVTGL